MSLFSDQIEPCETFATNYKKQHSSSNILYFFFYLQNPNSSGYIFLNNSLLRGQPILEHYFIKDDDNIYMSNTGNGFSYSSNDYKRHSKENNLTIQIFFNTLIQIFNAINSLNSLNSKLDERGFREIIEQISLYTTLIFNMGLHIDQIDNIVQLYTLTFDKQFPINKTNNWSYSLSIDDIFSNQDVKAFLSSKLNLSNLSGGKKKFIRTLYYKLNKKSKKKRRRRRRVTKKV
jgi:hypothetical protein